MTSIIKRLSDKEAEKRCILNYKRLGNRCGLDTSEVPFTKVGEIGIYTVNIRKYKTFNAPEPCWGYSLASDGGVVNKGDFTSYQEALDACIEAAIKEEEEFYKKFPELQN